jgi:cobalt-zinc-cadmium efflux system outer membrane protein
MVTDKTPTHNRTSVLPAAIATLAQFIASSAGAQQVWSDPLIVSRAKEHAPLATAARGEARRARARVEGAGLHPNPFVDWERQQTFAPNAQSQDVVRAHIPFDLSGRRAVARLLAEVDAEGSSAEATQIGLRLAARALRFFYRALSLKRRIDLLQEAQAVLDEADRVLASRQATGEVSGYERARLALEAELARSRLQSASAERLVAAHELAALLGAEGAARTLEGDFDVAAPPAIDVLVARASRAHPLLRSLDTRLALARRARGAAGTVWIPRFEIFGGYNNQAGPQVGRGYAVGVVLDLPVFDRGQGERAEADAALASVDQEARALRAALRAAVGAAHDRLDAALKERQRFAGATVEDTELLLRAARTGYRGGERTLVELLDARRAVLEVSERKLNLDLAVRLADVELRQVTGAL